MPKAREPKRRRPFTAAELDAARELHLCRFLPGSWDKRFARDLADIAKAQQNGHPGAGITQRQAEVLREQVYKYRRQVPAKVRAALEAETMPAMPEAPAPPTPDVEPPSSPPPAAVDDADGDMDEGLQPELDFAVPAAGAAP